MKNTPTKEKILQFVADQCGHSHRERIHPSADIVRDLRIDGDDADEFFENLLKQFPIELPAIDWSQHFHSEGELLSPLYFPKALAYKIGLSKSPPIRELIPFTIHDLLKLYGLNQ